jgi:hypothetical protein
VFYGGEIGHDHVGASLQTLFAPQGIDGTSAPSWPATEPSAAGCEEATAVSACGPGRRIIIPEPGVLLRNKRTDADHVG